MYNQKIIAKAMSNILAIALLCQMQQLLPAAHNPRIPQAEKDQQLLELSKFKGEDNDTINRMKILISHKHANVNVTDNEGCTPLLWAAKHNHLKKAPLLLNAKANPNIRSNDGQTATSMAVKNDYLEMVTLLFSNPQLPADPNYITSDGNPLLIVATENMYPAIVACLLNAGANPNLPSEYGETALIIAARNGTPFIIEILLQYGATIDTPDKIEMRTPLMWAILNNHIQAATILINHGADISKKDIDGKTAIDFVKELYLETDQQWTKILNSTH